MGENDTHKNKLVKISKLNKVLKNIRRKKLMQIKRQFLKKKNAREGNEK